MQSRPHRSLRPLGLVIKENGTHICISYKETEDASTGCNIFELCFSISEPPFNVKVAFCICDTGAAVKGVSPSTASKDKLRSAVAPDRGADKGNISLACRRPSVRPRPPSGRMPSLARQPSFAPFHQKRRKRDAPRVHGPKRVAVALEPKWQKDTSQIQSLGPKWANLFQRVSEP